MGETRAKVRDWVSSHSYIFPTLVFQPRSLDQRGTG